MEQDAEVAAKNLIDYMWTDDNGSVRLPIDPVLIAVRLGLKIFEADLAANVSGSLVKSAGADAVVLLNGSDSRNRRRFTCAHELGHFVRHSSQGDEEFEYVEHRDSLSAAGLDPDEIYANQFAAALLMPAHLVEEHRRDKGVVELANVFRVSADAMSYRLKNLGLVAGGNVVRG